MPFKLANYNFKADSIFDGLPPKVTKLLRGNIQVIQVAQDEVLFRQGTYSKGLYILKKGKVKIYQVNADGKEQIVYIYNKGELMGYRPLLCNQPHSVTATSLEDSEIHFIPAVYFLDAIDQSSTLSRKLLLNLSHEFTVLINKISVFAQQPVLQRVAIALLILNEKYKPNQPTTSNGVINLSRDDIANFVGTTTESLVRMLRYLKDENIIQANGRQITIVNEAELEKIATIC